MDALAERLASRLQANPDDSEAYGQLKAYYRESRDLASLTNLIEGWAAFQTDPVRASQGYLEAAHVAAEVAPHSERHRQLLQLAAKRDITNRAAVFDLITEMSGRGDAHALAEFLDQHLRAMEDGPHDRGLMAALYTRLAALWSQDFGRADVARRCYERALELDPASNEIVEAARALAQSSGDEELLKHVSELASTTELTPEGALAFHRQQAKAAQAAGDLDGAVQALQAAMKLAPTDIGIMHQLASALSRRAAHQNDENAQRDLRRVSELHYQVAQAVAPEDALDYLEAALAASPNHEGALHLMEQLAETFGRKDMLPKYWLGYLAHAGEGPELDQRRVYMAGAYERAGQLDDAIYCLEQIRTEDMAAAQLSELRARRGPRAVPAEASAAAVESAQRIAPAVPERPLDTTPLVRELRRRVRDAITSRDTAEAVKSCHEILELEPGDAEAFALLETYYRKTREYARLRELLLASTRVSGVSVAMRKQRLREVAALSEAKLKDVEGAIQVWRNVVALDPADADASKSLKRLLQRTERWDELAGVLEREALASQDPSIKAELLAQIATIHRDKRKDLADAGAALRQLLVLRPDAAVRDELCEILLSIESYADAVPLLRQRIADTSGEREQLRLLRQLAETLELKLHEPEAAYDVYKRIVEVRPKQLDALERMQTIDEQSGNTMRLLDTLERRAALVLRGDRATLLAQMAEIADRKLDDVERAAGYYQKALELEPAREGLLDALSQMFEQKQRFAELSQLLLQAASAERDPARRMELQLRRARLLRGPLAKPGEAAAVYREVLAHHEHAEAVGFLLELARAENDHEAIAELSGRLASLVAGPQARRALLYERAQVLAHKLGRARDAVRALRDILEKVDPSFEPAIDWLIELSGQLGDNAALASALQRRLAQTQQDTDRIALAVRLADLCELELKDASGAIAALQAWAAADSENVTPQRRLRKLLEDAGRWPELMATCDALANLEEEFDARDRATLDAAQIAATQLHDVDGAWHRLTPLVEDGQPEALQLMASIARPAQRSDAFAALCVQAAQAAKTPEIQGRLWGAAVRSYAQDLNNPVQALEAALRLLATDLSNRAHLGEVEECAANAAGWGRLGPVYDRLIKAAGTDAERIELLTRYADVLELRAQNASDALDRVLLAAALAPDDEALIARAEQLAQRTGRGAELLALCEQQGLASEQAPAKVEWLLRAARFAVSTLDDRTRASAYLGAALAATRAEPELWEQVVRSALAFDATQDEGEPHAMLRALVQVHRELADNSPAPLGPTLLLRASRLALERLDDPRAAFDVLRQGSGRFPLDENLYDALFARAEALGRLDALDAHLSRAVDDAMDPKSAAALLARRARLLEGPLGKPEDAADVFAKLLRLRPEDANAAIKLRDSLRKAKRYQDLLLVIHKQMQRVKIREEKLELLKESAQVWELDLKNRWEALDAWRKVAEFAPEDAEARRAVVRLDRRSARPAADESTDVEITNSVTRTAPEESRSTSDMSHTDRPSEPTPATSAAAVPSVATHAAEPVDETDVASSELVPIEVDESHVALADEADDANSLAALGPRAELASGYGERRSAPPPPPPQGTSPRRPSTVPPQTRPTAGPPPLPPSLKPPAARPGPSIPPPLPPRKN